MTIKKEDFFTHIGDIIQIHDTNIPDGTYQIVEADGDKEILFNIKEHLIIGADLPKGIKFNIFTTPTTERLELLYDALVKIIFNAMQEDDDEKVQAIENWTEKANTVKFLLEEEL